jgi:outer membrane protein OmpA-like peptidoglycan-associated protein
VNVYRPVKSIAVAALLFSCGNAMADPPAGSPPPRVPGKHVSFVTCPIFRDAVSQCWLAEHQGEVFYIGRYMLAVPPQLLHKVLVEGEISAEPRSCGGIVIQPIHLSVLPEIDRSCDTVLNDNGDKPSEPGFTQAPPQILDLIGEPLPPPPGPYSDTAFAVPFGFGSTFLGINGQQIVENAAKYAIASKAKRIEITGFAASSKLDDGTVMVEDAALADKRANDVSIAMAGIGVKRSLIKINPHTLILTGDGIHDADNRRVSIKISAVTRGKASGGNPGMGPMPPGPMPPGAMPPGPMPPGAMPPGPPPTASTPPT